MAQIPSNPPEVGVFLGIYVIVIPKSLKYRTSPTIYFELPRKISNHFPEISEHS